MFQKIKLQLSFQKLKKPKNFWLAGVFSLVTGLAMIWPKITSAQFGILSSISGAVISKIASWASYAIGWIGSQIIILEGQILDWIVTNSQFTKLAVVQTGWSVARDIANLFFIGILIYIAFGAILRLSKFNAPQLLFKLVLIAILINFSMSICGIIIDFSQTLFKFFIFAPMQGDVNLKLSSQLAYSLSLQDFWKGRAADLVVKGATSIDFGLTSAALSAMGQIIFTTIFTYVTVITFGAVIAILFVRNIYLWVLLILAPIAWFCGIVPRKEISGYASKWWSDFIKWVTVAPIMGFFIFLSLVAASGSNRMQLANNLTASNTSDLFKENFGVINILQFTSIIAIMFAGIGVASQVSPKIAKAATGLIMGAKNRATGWMQRKGRIAAGRTIGVGLEKAAGKFATIPVLGTLAGIGLGKAGRSVVAGGRAAKEKEIEVASKTLKNRSVNELSDMFATLSGNEKIAAIQKAVSAGKLPENMKDMAMKLAGSKWQIDNKKLLEIDPTLRSEWQPAIKKIVELEKQKEALKSVPVPDPDAIQNKEKEIVGAKAEFHNQASETFKDFKPAEIVKITATVMNTEKISEGVRDVFASRAADLDPITIMATIHQITELSQKVNFAKSVLKIKMDRVPDAADLSDRQKFEALDPAFKQKLGRNAGLRELDFMKEFEAGLVGTGAVGVVKTKEEKVEAWLRSKEPDIVEESHDVGNV
ncbi:MAG: hypothetical protein Q8N90_04385 [bacterium]|nr:hypothetical protein [bacterium]